MVIAELSHNPYLLETKVKFNGHGPRVNSAIDKYVRDPLVDWVHRVPQMFHDEMNGYDFDLFFSGTDADFESVQFAFDKAGVTEESVRILRKGSLGSPVEKMAQVLELVEWLKANHSPRLDVEEMLELNPDLTDASFPLIVVHGQDELEAQSRLVLEQVNDVTELDNSDLTSIPIVVSILPESAKTIAREVQYLLERHDITTSQLFFTIHRTLRWFPWRRIR